MNIEKRFIEFMIESQFKMKMETYQKLKKIADKNISIDRLRKYIDTEIKHLNSKQDKVRAHIKSVKRVEIIDKWNKL